MLWIETKTQADADARHQAMWGLKVESGPDGTLTSRATGEGLYEDGEFWADALKRVRNNPVDRLTMARRHLPLPAAFREAAIALRSIIRARRKAGEQTDDVLLELHHLAAVASLAAYDPLEITPFSKICALDLSPQALGWDALPLLGVTDTKLMSELWGEPPRHMTGRDLYPHIEQVARTRLKRQRDAALKRSTEEIDRAFAVRAVTEEPKPSGLLARLSGWIARLSV